MDTAKEKDKSIDFGGIKDDFLEFVDQKKQDFLDEGIDGLFGDDAVNLRDNVILPTVDEGIKSLPQFLEPVTEKVKEVLPEMTPDKQNILDTLEDLMFKDDDKPSKKTEEKKDEPVSGATGTVTDSPVDSGVSSLAADMEAGADKQYSKKEAKEASKGIADLTGNKGKRYTRVGTAISFSWICHDGIKKSILPTGIRRGWSRGSQNFNCRTAEKRG